MSIAVLTANLGNFDKQIDPVEQSVPFDFYRFTDENFPPRYCSMTPRLQARIVKMFGWQMIPKHDIYIWVDSSCALLNKDSVKWLTEQMTDDQGEYSMGEQFDIFLFEHPNRYSIQEEADYLKKRLAKKCPYITPRYTNELIDEQLAEIKADKDYVDDRLFASTVIVYRNSEDVFKMMKEWWYHTSRYHSIDQLSLPYVLKKSGCSHRVLVEGYDKTPYITYVRK